jgi:hypothetical protein
MTTYTINSECGVERIQAESIDAAKDIYSAKHGFDFDGYADYPGSWYFISVDGLRVEDHCECMPG